MKVKALLERIFFGKPVKGEKVKKDYEMHHSRTIPSGPRQSEAEWKKEFKVGSQYSRFNKQGIWYTDKPYGDESVSEHNDMLKRIMTGSI